MLAAGCLLLVAIIAMAFARCDIPIPIAQDSEPWYSDILNAVGLFSLLAMGGYLTIRLPGNVLVWLMLVAGFGYALHLFAVAYTYTSYLVVPEPLPLTALMFVLTAVGLAFVLPAIALTFILFPSGRLPSVLPPEI